MRELEESKTELNKAVSHFHHAFYKPEMMKDAVKELDLIVRKIKKLVK